MTLEELYSYADENDIDIDVFPMRELVSAAFPEGCIAIDKRKVKTKADEKAILAHEIGHCETGSFYNIHSAYDIKSRHEHKANVWSYKKLVPHDELLSAVKKGITEIWDLAEYFGVPCEFMQHAAEYWRAKEITE